LEIESIDRMFCNVYVPQLQHVGGVVGFFRVHRGEPFASSALRRAGRAGRRTAGGNRTMRVVRASRDP
jgi:hypothetical protein